MIAVNELAKWLRHKKQEAITTKVVNYYQGRQVVSKDDLISILNTTSKTIERYVKDGMPQCEDLTSRAFQVFYLEDALAWRVANIRGASEIKTEFEAPKRPPSSKKEAKTITGIPIEEMTLDEADLELKKLKIVEQELKNKELSGDLIRADSADKTIAEFASVFIGFLRDSREVLSGDLAMKTKDIIFKRLDDYFGNFIKDMNRRVNE